MSVRTTTSPSSPSSWSDFEPVRDEQPYASYDTSTEDAPASEEGYALPDLTSLVREIAAEPEIWRPHVRFDESGRYWTKLQGDEHVDVWLLTWLHGQGTELHDHGGSSAAFTVVEGELREVRSVRGETADGSAAHGLSEFSRVPGRTAWVSPDVVHDVENAGSTPAISIHAYSPPLRSMTYYRQDGSALVPLETVATDEPERR